MGAERPKERGTSGTSDGDFLAIAMSKLVIRIATDLVMVSAFPFLIHSPSGVPEVPAPWPQIMIAFEILSDTLSLSHA